MSTMRLSFHKNNSHNSGGIRFLFGYSAILLFWSSTLLSLLLVQSQPITQKEGKKEEKKCSIFIAPSSLRGNEESGFGVYTSRSLTAGDAILSGPPGTPDGPSIPVTDPGYGINAAYNQWNEVFGHYWWGRGVPEYTRYEARNVMDFQITFGALPNHHCILGSLDMYFPTATTTATTAAATSTTTTTTARNNVDAYDDSLVNRFQQAGAGAYSYHRGRIFVTQHDLPAGSEIFLSYGYCSRYDLEHPDQSRLWYPEWTKSIPMREDYHDATEATLALWNDLLTHYNHDVDQIPNDLNLTDAKQEHSLALQSLSPRGFSLIPPTSGHLKRLMAQPQQHQEEDRHALMVQLAREFSTTPRTPEWVHEHGLCIEHLIPGKSTLPNGAGQGAFAQHTIRRGDMVVPVPLLHILDKSVLYLLEDNDDDDDDDEETVKISATQQQLLTNYCFSHPETSLMLCPTSNAILINHCSTRTKECGEHGPNAYLRWAQPSWDPRTERWLNATLDEMAPNLDRMLAMEIVALRDILPGDEVFIDYGVEWEEAWQRHLEEWEPYRRHEAPLHFSIAEANNIYQHPRLPHLVSNTIRGGEVDHPYIFTGCLYWPTEMDEEHVFLVSDENPGGADSEVNFDEMTDGQLLERFADDGSFYKIPRDDEDDDSDLDSHRRRRAVMDSFYWPCAVIFEDNETVRPGEDDEVTYLVRIKQHPSLRPKQPWAVNEWPRYLYHFPRSSIRYFAKPYSSDAFLPNAFRHPIGIPDDMMPKQWRNLAEEDDDDEEDDE